MAGTTTERPKPWRLSGPEELCEFPPVLLLANGLQLDRDPDDNLRCLAVVATFKPAPAGSSAGAKSSASTVDARAA